MSKQTAVPTASRIVPKMGRCTHRFAASGRQCRLLTSDPSGLCAHHLARKKAAAQSADFAELLFDRAEGMKTAQGINHSLTYLYELLARDLISVRRAQSLAYISSLILRTLPAIDYDTDRGITPNSYQSAQAKRDTTKQAATPAAALIPAASASSPNAIVPAPAVDPTSSASSSVSSPVVGLPLPTGSAAGSSVLASSSVVGIQAGATSSVASGVSVGGAIPDPPPHTKPS